MYIELIDLLRCPREHEDSWLVAAFYKMDGRFVIEGKLGCPVCSAMYPITRGVADLRASAGDLPQPQGQAAQPGADDAMPFAAMLGLTKPGLTLVLTGDAAPLAPAIAELGQAQIIVYNPSTLLDETERAAMVLGDTRFPLADASIDGVLLGSVHQSGLLAETLRILKAGGRLVGPARLELTGSFRELARDDQYVVAESVGNLVPLMSRRDG